MGHALIWAFPVETPLGSRRLLKVHYQIRLSAKFGTSITKMHNSVEYCAKGPDYTMIIIFVSPQKDETNFSWIWTFFWNPKKGDGTTDPIGDNEDPKKEQFSSFIANKVVVRSQFGIFIQRWNLSMTKSDTTAIISVSKMTVHAMFSAGQPLPVF